MAFKLCDLFSGAGGAAMGYALAGFEVNGCDIEPQNRYPFHFTQMDWREYLEKYGHLFDAFHASPPCQAYSALKHMTTMRHPELIEPVREALRATGKPYVIENVEGAKKYLREPLILCGSIFGLQTSCGAQLRRHRLFESNVFLMSPGPCRHGESPLAVNGHEFRNEATRWEERRQKDAHRPVSIYGGKARDRRVISMNGDHPRDESVRWDRRRTITVTGSTPQQNVERNRIRETFSIEEARRAMGIDWMVMRELSQAIPPAYTFWIGCQLISDLERTDFRS